MRIITLYIAFFLCQFVVAQESKLQKSMQKAQMYFELPKDTLVFHAKFVIINSKNESDKGLAYHYLGNTYKINGNLDLALKNYKIENSIFKKLLVKDYSNNDIKDNYANSLAAIAIVYSNQSNYTQALSYHFKAKKLFTETNNLKKLAAVSNNIAIEYQSLNKFEIANNYFNDAIKFNKDKTISNVLLYTNIAKNLIKSENLKQAKVYLEKALSFNFNENNFEIKAELYNNFAFYYYKQNDLSNQKKYIDLAFKVAPNNDFVLTDTYFYLGLYYLAQNSKDEAKTNFEKSIQLCKKNKIIEQQANVEEQLANLFKSEGDFKNAFFHLQNYSILNESLITNNNEKAIAYVEQIAAFEKQKDEIKILDFKQNQQLLGYSFLVAALLSIFGFLWYQNRQKLIKNNLKLEKDISEFHQKAMHLQMNPHFIFNCLGSISGFILQNENETALQYLSHFAKLMRLTLENSKEKTISIDKEIESITQYFQLEKLRHDAIFNYTITKNATIDEVIKMPPMLLQPLIENAIIHGIIPKKEGEINVDFNIINDQLQITIKDNGLGYYVSKNKKAGSVLAHKSMALEIVKNRIQALEGQFNVEEIIKENSVSGTKITIFLPI